MSAPLAIGRTATSPAPQDPRAQLRTAAQQFEAVFLRQMIGSMRQAKLADDPLDSSATDQFREMADGQLADNMSHQGAFGIAQMLIAQFEHQVGGQAQPGGQAQAATDAAAAPPAAANNGVQS